MPMDLLISNFKETYNIILESIQKLFGIYSSFL